MTACIYDRFQPCSYDCPECPKNRGKIACCECGCYIDENEEYYHDGEPFCESCYHEIEDEYEDECEDEYEDDDFE